MTSKKKDKDSQKSNNGHATCGKMVIRSRGGKRGPVAIPTICGKPQGHPGRC